MLCVPLRNRDGEAIGVTQVLNKRAGDFSASDLALAEAINRHAASAVEQAFLVERLELAQREEIEILTIAEAISTELHLDVLFARIIAASTKLLDAERSTLFLYDAESGELWSQIAEGAGQKEIRIPARAGIAGAAFAAHEVLVVPDAYADPRFNREIDRASGYRTRNILAVPITGKAGERLGVVQVLNKRGGAFAPIDIKGKSRPTLAYELLDHYDPDRYPKLSALIATYEAGLDCYKRRDWRAAIRLFGEALELAPTDRPSRIFIDRCRYYRESPPPEDWNGVWILQDK